jgi:hypothetical protein
MPTRTTSGAGDPPKVLAPPTSAVPTVTPAKRTHRRLPALRPCHVPAEAANGGLIDAYVGGGATCRQAHVVLLAVSHWSGRTCWERCASHHSIALGFACTTYKIGEADWSVNCWKARKIVHTSLAD